MLEKKFKTLCSIYSRDIPLINTMWTQITNSYNTSTRHYHNLNHLIHIYKELESLNFSKEVWKELRFALFYHDIVYDIQRDDNEKQSAIVANTQLSLLGIKITSIQNIIQLIHETKMHQSSSINHAYFLDADLAVLGSSTQQYKKYTLKIRKEYNVYSDKEYKKGRKKVLEFFFNQKRLFNTQYFYQKYEKQAQKNLLSEYHQL